MEVEKEEDGKVEVEVWKDVMVEMNVEMELIGAS